MGSLNQTQVKNAKPGRHGDGDGLYLLVSPTGGKSWVLRVQADGKRRDVGLGTADTTSRVGTDRSAVDEVPILQRRRLSLAEAREKAGLLRAIAKTGRDPVAERDKDRKKAPTFKEAAIAAHEALAPGWAVKNAAAFLSSLEEHAYPRLGELRIDAIEAADIRDMLAPIWIKIPVMARKVRQRVGTVLNFSKSKGWRATEAPTRSIGVGLPNQPTDGNFKSMPYAALPGFVAETRAKPDTNGRLALLFMIFTVARPGEVRSARWEHIDLNARDWNRPADLMKGRRAKAHTITLNDAAVGILQRLKTDRSPKETDLLFPSKSGTMISDMTLSKALRDANVPYDAHGFRSSFRDWAAEKMPEIPDPVAEAALAHVVPDKVVRAYKRTTFLEMRRKLLDAWGAFSSSAK